MENIKQKLASLFIERCIFNFTDILYSTLG